MAKRIVDEEMRFTIVINGNKAQKELHDLEKNTRELTAANKALRAERAQLAKEGKRNTEEYKKLSAEIQANSNQLQANKARMATLQKEIGVTGLTMRQLQRRARDLRLQLLNMVPGSADYKRLQADLKATNAQLFKLRNGARQTQSTLSKLASGANKYQALGFSIIASITGVVLSIQKFIDFSGKLADAQSNVQKTTGLTDREIKGLMATFGAFNTRSTRLELLELAEEAGRLGIEGKKNIENFVKEANKIKVALGDDLSTEQIREVGKLVNIYKVGEATGKDFAGAMDALGSAINEVSASGANQASFLVEYLKRQAGVAAQAKLSAADNIGYAATFDEIGQSVEVAATAVNKVLLDLFENPGEYAKIAGIEVKEFNKLLQEDSNEAFIKFLEGLNGNNEGLSVMVQKIEELDAGGTRGVQALSALANSTDLLRKRQDIANKSQQEAISLTNEYNLKNENLAANLAKLKRFFTGLVTPLISGFTKGIELISKFTSGLNTNVKALERERLELFKVQSQLFSTNLETEQRVKLINELKASYPELLRDINAETVGNEELRVALKAVNDELINRIIIARKQQEIDEQNETTANKLEKRLKAEEKLRTIVGELTQRYSEFKFDADKTELQNAKRLFDFVAERTKGERTYFEQGFRDRRNLSIAIRGLEVTEMFYNNQVAKGNILLEEREALMERLGIKNTEASNRGTEDGGDENQPKEGDTKFIAGELYTFKNGRWQKVIKPNPKTSSNSQSNLLDILRKNQDLKNQLIQDDFLRELAILETNHNVKIQKLKEQLLKEGNLTEEQIKENAAIKEQMQLEEEIFLLQTSKLVEEYILKDNEALKAKYEKERTIRETAFNEALAMQNYTQEEKARLREDFERRELIEQSKYLQEVKSRLENALATGDFKGINLEILTESQKQAIVDRLQELGLSLSEINKLLAQLRGGSLDDLGIGLDVDVLGYTIDQWESSFDNLETLRGKIEAAQMGVNALMNVWSMYNQFASAADRKRLQEFERNNQAQQEMLAKRLDAGLINQRQYNEAQEALERNLRKKQAEAEYKAAKRDKEIAIAGIGLNTAVAVSKALAQGGFVLGVPWAAIVGALGAVQLALAIAQPLPSAEGFEQGYGYGQKYPVRRSQDGKVFNVEYGGIPQSGIVNKPTHFIAGEQGQFFPELIVSGPDLKRFNPDLRASISNELARIKGFEKGFTGTSLNDTVSNTNSEDSAAMMSVMLRVGGLLERLERKGIIAFVSKDMRDIEELQKKLDQLNKYKTQSKVQ